jgi:hypothetical protein
MEVTIQAIRKRKTSSSWLMAQGTCRECAGKCLARAYNWILLERAPQSEAKGGETVRMSVATASPGSQASDACAHYLCALYD